MNLFAINCTTTSATQLLHQSPILGGASIALFHVVQVVGCCHFYDCVVVSMQHFYVLDRYLTLVLGKRHAWMVGAGAMCMLGVYTRTTTKSRDLNASFSLLVCHNFLGNDSEMWPSAVLPTPQLLSVG